MDFKTAVGFVQRYYFEKSQAVLITLRTPENGGPLVMGHVQGLETRMRNFQEKRGVIRQKNDLKSIVGKWLKTQGICISFEKMTEV